MYFRVFTKSLLTPRLSSILAAFISFVLIIFCFNSYLVLKNFRNCSLSSMLSSERDDFGHLSYILSHLPNKPYFGVFALGGSGVREGLPLSSILSRQIQKSSMNQVFFENFSSSSQSMSESLEVVSNIIKQGNAKKGSLFIIAVNPRRFTESPKQAINLSRVTRIPLIDNEELKEFLKEQGCKVHWTPNFIRQKLAIFNFILGRIDSQYIGLLLNLRNFNCGISCMHDLLGHSPFSRPQTYLQFVYPKKSMPASTKNFIKTQVETFRVPEFKKNSQFSLQILKRIIELAQKHHYKVLLLELPRSPESYAGYQAIEKSHKEMMAQLQAKGITYRDLRDEAKFPTSSFYDIDHLNSSKSRAVVGKELVKIIKHELKF